MLVFDVRGDMSKITQHLTNLSKEQVPFATALALTRTAKFSQLKIKEEIPRVFDRPTRFTLDSSYVYPATKQNLKAEVCIKDERLKADAPIKWLAPQIYGGNRSLKAFERKLASAGRMPYGCYVVPAKGAVLDAYGNINRGQLQAILSDLQAQLDKSANTTAASRQRRRRSRTRRAAFYFSTWPINDRTAHLAPGIYKRTEFGFGSAIKPYFVFVTRARYRRRLRFFEIADQTSRMRFPIEFALAMRQAIATAR